MTKCIESGFEAMRACRKAPARVPPSTAHGQEAAQSYGFADRVELSSIDMDDLQPASTNGASVQQDSAFDSLQAVPVGAFANGSSSVVEQLEGPPAFPSNGAFRPPSSSSSGNGSSSSGGGSSIGNGNGNGRGNGSGLRNGFASVAMSGSNGVDGLKPQGFKDASAADGSQALTAQAAAAAEPISGQAAEREAKQEKARAKAAAKTAVDDNYGQAIRVLSPIR